MHRRTDAQWLSAVRRQDKHLQASRKIPLPADRLNSPASPPAPPPDHTPPRHVCRRDDVQDPRHEGVDAQPAVQFSARRPQHRHEAEHDGVIARHGDDHAAHRDRERKDERPLSVFVRQARRAYSGTRGKPTLASADLRFTFAADVIAALLAHEPRCLLSCSRPVGLGPRARGRVFRRRAGSEDGDARPACGRHGSTPTNRHACRQVPVRPELEPSSRWDRFGNHAGLPGR